MESSDKLTKRLKILRELRTVTETMRALSAVNIRHYENAALAVTEHDKVVELGFRSLAINTGVPTLRTASSTRLPARLVIVFGSDHGLCGRFNERIIDYARTTALTDSENSPTTTLDNLSRNTGTVAPNSLLVAGQIAGEISTATGLTPHATFSLPGTVDSIPQIVHSLIIHIDEWMHDHPESCMDVFHHRPTADNAIEIKHSALLPVKRSTSALSGSWPTHNLPGITLPPETLLAALLREHIFIGLYRACAESQSAEHSSRLASMQAACRNIDEQITNVDRELRKHRQSSITSELLDTISGYESIAKR